MKHVFFLFTLIVCSLMGFSQKAVEKTNPMKVYMHYMPWFDTPETHPLLKWGWHWTMNTKNPGNIDADGKREIASHYYPKIGPYASSDKDVIEYHLLLMKLSGVDGILIDWYGVKGSNGDINELLRNSDSVVSYTDDFGLGFAVVLEDRFTGSVSNAKDNVTYLKNNYFSRAEYIRVGVNEDPLLMIFGPITFQSPSQWTDILSAAGEDVEFLTLWGESHDAGTNADGEQAWVWENEASDNFYSNLQGFYNSKAPGLKTVAGVAYPGFNDFYDEGGAGAGLFNIPHENGQTLDQTLSLATQHSSSMEMLQLATWNDFGEGTMFEPTDETGYSYLKKIQQYTGVPYGEYELNQVYKLYSLRKKNRFDPNILGQLDQASVHFRNLEIAEGVEILNAIEPVTGLSEDESEDSQVNVYPNPVYTDYLTVELKEPLTKNTITLSDLLGNNIYQGSTKEKTSSVSIHKGTAKGVYILKVMNEKGVSSKRLIFK